MMAWTRNEMAARAAQKLKTGYCLNLGIGIPPLVVNHVPDGCCQTNRKLSPFGARSTNPRTTKLIFISSQFRFGFR